MTKNKIIFIVIILLALLLIIQFKPKKSSLYNVNVDGHAYVFKYNPKISIKIPCNNPEGIQVMAFKSNRFVIIFNGTNSKDNALFSVIGQNIVLKLKPYFEFQGIYKNYTAAEIDNFTYNNGDFIIYLKGPNTGANGTYVKLDGNKVLISGNTTDEAQMAGDKFILTVMGLYEKSHS